MSVRSTLDEQALTTALVVPGGLWTSIEVSQSLPSSNGELAGRAAAGHCAPGTVLVAEEQTAGRGRRDRSWVAPRGSSVMVSVLVEPRADPTRWGWVPLVTALAIADALTTAGVAASIKWPNDVMAGESKVAGVLCEVVSTPRGPALVAGWGINVDQTVAELPTAGATSVRQLGGVVDRAALLVECLRGWERWYREWVASSPGNASVSAAYTARSNTLGRSVAAHLPDDRVVTGTALRIDGHGHLVLDVDGAELVVAAADVVHLRSNGLPP